MHDFGADGALADTVDLDYFSMDWYARVQSIVQFWKELDSIPEELLPTREGKGGG